FYNNYPSVCTPPRNIDQILSYSFNNIHFRFWRAIHLLKWNLPFLQSSPALSILTVVYIFYLLYRKEETGIGRSLEGENRIMGFPKTVTIPIVLKAMLTMPKQ